MMNKAIFNNELNRLNLELTGKCFLIIINIINKKEHVLLKNVFFLKTYFFKEDVSKFVLQQTKRGLRY